jgi:hypothetical protein
MVHWREVLNNIVTRNHLEIRSDTTQHGPENDARWHVTYSLKVQRENYMVIGQGYTTTKLGSREEAAMHAVAWLQAHNYRE